MQALTLAIVSCVATLLVGPFMIRLATRFDLVDRPVHRKRHQRPIPYLGGLTILFGAMPALGWLLYQFRNDFQTLERLALLVGLGIAGGVLGLWDDWKPLLGRHKLVAEILIIVPFVIVGFRLESLDIPSFGTVDLGLWSVPITVLWILTVSNAVNLIDGLDGLATSVVASMILASAACAYILNDMLTLLVSLALFGALVGFLRFNWAPARMHLGDSGSLGLGMFAAMALVAIAQPPSMLGSPHAQEQGSLPFEYRVQLIALVALYPLLEIGLSVIRRAVQGRGIGAADNDHIHHSLQREGWTRGQICGVATLISVLGGSAAAASILGYHALTAVAIMAASVTVGVVLHLCGYPEQFFPSRVRAARRLFQMCHHFSAMQTLKLRSADTTSEIWTLLDQACVELGVANLRVMAGDDEGPPTCVHQWFKTSPSTARDAPSDRANAPRGEIEARWWFDHGTCPPNLALEHRIRFHSLVCAALDSLTRLREKDAEQNLEPRQTDSPVACREYGARLGTTPEAPHVNEHGDQTPIPTAHG